MKKTFKSMIAVTLCFIMLMGTIAIGGDGFGELLDAISIKAEAYSTGDYIYYGTYPQTDVTDSLGSVLNSQSGTWKSYGYYSGSGSWNDGKMVASDYMRYKDVEYNGNKYRAVTFDSYRPYCTGYTSSTSNTYQDDNGYTPNNVYWFKYEPIKWRVLDPSTGLVMCATAIDSQAYNNYFIYNSSVSDSRYAYFGNESQTYYSSDYANSSIRQWLNNDFYNTAFSSEQKSNILTSALNNDGYYTLTGTTGYETLDSASTNDKVFLLSYNEVLNSNYGFSTSSGTYDSARQLKGSDYAKSQGLYVYHSSGSSYDGCSYWRLRSPGDGSSDSCGVGHDGGVYIDCTTDGTDGGVVPALKLQNLKSDYAGSDIEVGGGDSAINLTKAQNAVITVPNSNKIGWKYRAKMTASANLPEGYHLVWYEGNTPVSDEATFTTNQLTSDHTYTAKIADASGKIVSSVSQEKSVTVSVKTGFFDKLISFFSRLFGNDITTL